MNKICTTIEQSKKLLELGIDVNTADMFWDTLFAKKPEAQVINHHFVDEYDDEHRVPAWSLTALMELIPDKISINNESYYLSFTKKSVEYRGLITWDGQKSKSFELDNILDACYEMVVWLKENGKI